jgi:hypothetical protein
MKTCASPLAFETLVALWAGELPEAQTAAADEHLFACEACSAASDRLGKVVTGLRGLVPPVLSHALRDRLASQGMRLRVTNVQPGVEATAHFTRDVDLLIHVLHADLSRAARVDVEVLAPDGEPRVALEQVPFDATKGEVLIACQRHYEHMLPPGVDPIFRVHAFEAGERRRVGDYLVIHVWYA